MKASKVQEPTRYTSLPTKHGWLHRWCSWLHIQFSSQILLHRMAHTAQSVFRREIESGAQAWRFSLYFTVSVYLLMVCAPLVQADKTRDLLFPYYSASKTTNECSTLSLGKNLDYAGRAILTQGQIAKIGQNQPVYQEAANKVGIPWQMLAVVHLREHGLAVDNPNNLTALERKQGVEPYSNGAYQNLSNRLPTGRIDQAEFLRQSVQAAEFLKHKAKSNYSGNQELKLDSPPEVIKDTFFSYNGRAGVYEKQAGRLGFDPNTQGYEGSPYVMNKADEQRDPEFNKTTWGQVKRDGGPIEYPANKDYGAYVVYAALTGAAIGACQGALASQSGWPTALPATLTSCYGPRNRGDGFHDGLDIVGPDGSPVFAVADGRVIFAGPNGVYGPNWVKIDHGNGVVTQYGHMKSKLVSKDDEVKAGQQIGAVGDEGDSDGSHLHIDFVVNGKIQNPLKHLLVDGKFPGKVSDSKGCLGKVDKY